MELQVYANAVGGLRTLAELERRDPKLASDLEEFVAEVLDVCERAYGRFAATLSQVIALEDADSPRQRAMLQKKLRETYSHEWFKQVALICGRLHALDAAFTGRICRISDAPRVSKSQKKSLAELIRLLTDAEGAIERDIQSASSKVGNLIAKASGSGNAAPARAKAQEILAEINKTMRAAREVRFQFLGSSKRGSRAVMSSGLKAEAERVDFVIITALEEELRAVMSQLQGWKVVPASPQDVRVYRRCEVKARDPDGNKINYSAILLLLLGMGRVEATSAAGDAIRRWRPRYVLLVGIAGGIADAGVTIGDVIVSDQVVDYELQKQYAKGASIRYNVYKSDPRLLGVVQETTAELLAKLIKARRPEPGAPKRLIGPIATGDKVVAFGKIMNRYRREWPKLVGVEMEAGGVAAAAFQSADQPGFFMIRAVSDLADERKDEAKTYEWRTYACEAAAAYAAMVLKSGLIPK
jgi:5'-methylthioadenosine/S-adenosylhomocysteine nucleosidase